MSVEDKIYRERLTLASIAERFFAFLIDKILVSFVFVVVIWNEIAPLQKDYVSVTNYLQTKILYFMGLEFIYEVIFLVLYGATLGKIALKIKVVSIGIFDRPNLIYALIRTMCKIIGENLFYAPFFYVFFSPIQQTLHDILGRTIVIKND